MSSPALDSISSARTNWDVADTVARGWQIGAASSLLIPDPTISKAIALSGVVPSAYLGGRGLWKIVHDKNYFEGSVDVGMSLVGGGLYLNAARAGALATRTAIAAEWSALPRVVQYGIPAVLVYPFAQELYFSYAMEFRSHVIVPWLRATPFAPLFPSIQGINGKNLYEIQAEQELFRQEMRAGQKEILEQLKQCNERNSYDNPHNARIEAVRSSTGSLSLAKSRSVD